MSQGFIAKKGTEQPSKMDVFMESVECEGCVAEFSIFHHRAHPENIEEQVAWLKGVLKIEHKRNSEHQNAYHFPG